MESGWGCATRVDATTRCRYLYRPPQLSHMSAHRPHTTRGPLEEKKNLRNANRNERSRGRHLLHGTGPSPLQRLAVGGSWRLAVDGSWRLAVGGLWQLVVGGWWGLAVGG